MKIFYYHNLDLKLSSAQTLQVLNDYKYLSRLGNDVFIYGKYTKSSDYENIKDFLKDSNVHLVSKFKFFRLLLLSKKKIIVTRHFRKLKQIIFLKKFFKIINVHEMHEESFYYLFKSNLNKINFFKILNNASGIIFTNKSQLEFYYKEFERKIIPKYIIAPNGVEIDKFKNINFSKNKILTYVGQFNKWKNVEIIFQALEKLPKEYKLKIAGGQGQKDVLYVRRMIEKYNLNDRVLYKGFIQHKQVPSFINNSNVLLAPLGDNVQSKYLTSPMKFIEYMATGLPIVTMDYPTIRGLLCTRNNIFLSQNNSEDFAKQILAASESEKLELDECVLKFDYKRRSECVNKFFQYFFKI